MATMVDLDELALALPQATKELSEDGRPAYKVHGKLFCLHRARRPDALDPATGKRLDDVLMFRVADLDVKELLLADERTHRLVPFRGPVCDHGHLTVTALSATRTPR